MRNSITIKELYEKLIQMSDLHSVPQIDGEILIWNLYKNAYVRAYCDSYDTCIDVITLSGKPLTHWHPEEDDMFDELYALGKQGNILVLNKSLIGTGVFYLGKTDKYKNKWHFGKLIFLEQK